MELRNFTTKKKKVVEKKVVVLFRNWTLLKTFRN